MFRTQHRLLAAVSLLTLLACSSTSDLPAEVACLTGPWQFEDGHLLFIRKGSTTPLAFRHSDGRLGRLEPVDAGAATIWRSREGALTEGPWVAEISFDDCASGRLTFDSAGAGAVTARRVVPRAIDAAFSSHGIALQGRLVLPSGEGPWPLTVVVHGSERDSALENEFLQYLLPMHDIAVFVYDKRGTGRSEGEYSQDFDLLSDDAVEALVTAKRLHPDAFSEIGYLGGSQGAWIGPLAASKHPVDFVLPLYGLAESPLAEDREEVQAELRARGASGNTLIEAREVTDATGAVIASGFTAGFDALTKVKRKYGKSPWFSQIQGEYTGDLLRYPNWLLRLVGPAFDQGTSWQYEPQDVVPHVQAEQLWVLAADDTEAPIPVTRARLRTWQLQGAAIDLALFPDTEHGVYEFVVQYGERRTTRLAPGYLPLLIHWIQHRNLKGSFGRAELYPRIGAGEDADSLAR